MNYKILLAVPLIVLAISLAYLTLMTTTTGLNLDVDLKGGTLITAETTSPINENELENTLIPYEADVRIASGITGNSVFIEFDSTIEPQDVINTLEDSGYEFDDYSIQTVGPTLGAASFQQAIIVLIFAFIFMAGTILFIFKIPVVSFYISLCPAFDIIETLAISQILGIKLSLASFAALLMIIGYSVDDDVMIATRILKVSGDMKERLGSSFKTSFTTTAATLVALTALYAISLSTIITQIASVLLIGLLVDFQNTWLFDTTLLRWYTERKTK